METVKFGKSDVIKTKPDNLIWECIVADDDIAVFAKVKQYKRPYVTKKVVYTNLFVVSHKVNAGFNYVDSVGIDEATGKFIFSDDKYEYDKDEGTMWLAD
jgi:hypothetical protein